MRNVKLFAFALIVILPSAAAFGGDLPDPATTSGLAATDVDQSNIRSTICTKGFTRPPRRPPVEYTTNLKRQQLAAIGGDQNVGDFEEDHLIALEIGGDPRDHRNLWPEHWAEPWGAKTKDRLELKLHDLVCATTGAIPLAQAQTDIKTDWIAAYKKYCATQADCPSYEERQAAGR